MGKKAKLKRYSSTCFELAHDKRCHWDSSCPNMDSCMPAFKANLRAILGPNMKVITSSSEIFHKPMRGSRES